jgi:hypothetical protein
MPNVVWFQLLTPSDIAWVILLIKNGKSIWDQKKNLQQLDSNEVQMRKKPLFTAEQGTKRVLGNQLGIRRGCSIFTWRRRIGKKFPSQKSKYLY